MADTDYRVLANRLASVVSRLIEHYRPRLLDAAFGPADAEAERPWPADGFPSLLDLELHGSYRTLLAESLGEFRYIAEEAEPRTIGDDPALAIVVDPLDAGEYALRGLYGYTHVLAWSLRRDAPVAAVVGDFFHEVELYYAYASEPGRPGGAFAATRTGRQWPLRVRPTDFPDRPLVTNDSMRPAQRLLPLSRQTGLLELLRGDDPAADRGRIGVDFGSIGLCHVASGATDAFVEFAAGFALWDLLPGRFILEAAGGTVLDLSGNPLPWPDIRAISDGSAADTLDHRQTFVAAPTRAAAARLVTALV